MTLPSVAALVGGQTVEHGLIRSLLQVDIERRVNLQAAFVDLIGSVFIFQIASNFLDEIRCERIGIVLQMQVQRGRARVGGLRCGDLSIFEHGVDHQIAALQRAVGMVDRRIDSRPFGQACEQRGFGQRQAFAPVC